MTSEILFSRRTFAGARFAERSTDFKKKISNTREIQNTYNKKPSQVRYKPKICCITVLFSGQQFIDPLPAIELLTDDLIFISSTNHVILTSQYKNKKQ